MVDNLEEVCNIALKEERFNRLDDLLFKRKVFFGDVEDYYINEVSDKTIDFVVYYFNRGVNISKFEKAIIDSGNLYCVYLFAKNIKGANVSKLEDVIVNSLNTWYIYLFARNVKGANIGKLQAATIESNEALAMYSFAKNIKGADIRVLEDAIVLTGCTEIIYYFGQNVDGANRERLESVINEFNDTKVKVKRLDNFND